MWSPPECETRAPLSPPRDHHGNNKTPPLANLFTPRSLTALVVSFFFSQEEEERSNDTRDSDRRVCLCGRTVVQKKKETHTRLCFIRHHHTHSLLILLLLLTNTAQLITTSSHRHGVHPPEGVGRPLRLQLRQGLVNLQPSRRRLPRLAKLPPLALVRQAPDRRHHHRRARREQLVGLHRLFDGDRLLLDLVPPRPRQLDDRRAGDAGEDGARQRGGADGAALDGEDVAGGDFFQVAVVLGVEVDDVCVVVSRGFVLLGFGSSRVFWYCLVLFCGWLAFC